MGNDYAARRKGKRKPNPNTVEFVDQVKLGGKKERPKRAKVRRLCRGHCYQDPVVQDEDKQWPEHEMVEGAQSKGSKRSELPIVIPGQQPRRVLSAAAKTKKNRRRGKRNSGIHNLSTSLNLDKPPSGNLDGKEPSESHLVSKALIAYPDVIQRYMVSQGFIDTTPVQAGCWQAIIDGRDVVGIAEPGSGKTLAFLLPAVLKMTDWMTLSDARSPPWTIVIVPTRELTNQIQAVCRPLYRLFGIRTAHIYGGVDPAIQIEALEQVPHIVIGTPGRMVDLMKEGHLNLRGVRYVALDEGDKLLSPGMQDDCEALRNALPKDGNALPQIVVFSATMPDDVTAQLNTWLSDPEHLEFRPSARSVSPTITQVVHVCAEHKKPAKLQKHLALIEERSKEMRQKPRILIFSNSVKKVRFLEGFLRDEHKVVMLHGKRTQNERDDAIANFKAGKTQILVATDVAARGLHIRNLPYVINYDFPSRLETYIHRVGRTGRLAAYGHAFSFFTRNLAKLAPDLVSLLGHHQQQVDPNLLILSNAYQTAENVLTGNADQEDDEDELSEENSLPGGNESGMEGEASVLRQMTDVLLEEFPKEKKRRKKGILEK